MSEMIRSWENGSPERARELHTQLFPVMRALFIETNPIPIKAAMAYLKLCREEMRLPLVPMGADARKKLFGALKACPLLKKSNG